MSGMLKGFGNLVKAVDQPGNKLFGDELWFQELRDPLNLYGLQSKPGDQPTPEEIEARQAAQSYLDIYKSGKLPESMESLVEQGERNQTAALLQTLYGAGIGNSTMRFQQVGNVKQGLAGAGSTVDLAARSLEQKLLNYDLQIGQAYLGIAAGQSEDIAALEQAQQEAIANSLGAISQSLVQIYGGDNGGGG